MRPSGANGGEDPLHRHIQSGVQIVRAFGNLTTDGLHLLFSNHRTLSTLKTTGLVPAPPVWTPSWDGW